MIDRSGVRKSSAWTREEHVFGDAGISPAFVGALGLQFALGRRLQALVLVSRRSPACRAGHPCAIRRIVGDLVEPLNTFWSCSSFSDPTI